MFYYDMLRYVARFVQYCLFIRGKPCQKELQVALCSVIWPYTYFKCMRLYSLFELYAVLLVTLAAGET